MPSLTNQKIINLTWLIGFGCIFVIPDVVLGLLLGVIHVLLACIHLIFELVEAALDHFVEHTFHTGTRETQLIVFYIIAIIGFCGFCFLWWVTWLAFHKLKLLTIVTIVNQKHRCLMYWEESANNKFKLIAGFNVALTLVHLVTF